jgi:anaerobic magnesium-protoporphyrin IX monomethyl ester cyclase
MKKRVLLIYSNVMKESWVPIGLLYIAAYLRKNNIDVKISDSKYDNVFKDISEWKPNYIGLGGMTVMSKDAIKLGELIKYLFPNILLIYGGVHFTFLPKEAYHVADYIIRGEAEKAFLDIVTEKPGFCYDNGILIKQCGAWYNNTNDWNRIEDLDELPFPAYDLINMERYSDELVTGEKAISIMTGRGCPYNCSFCASPKLWKRKVRYHSVPYVIEHIKYLIKNYNLKCLRIMDDTFTCNNERVLEFCKAIKDNNIKLKMTCLTNVNNASLEVFKEMKSAGFDIVAFGIESANQTILNNINKNITKEKAREAIETAHKAGLRTELLFMVGNVGETEETLKESIEFSKSFNAFKVYFQLATPFPGSEFYIIARKYGEIIDQDWENYNHKEVKYIPNGLTKEIMLDTVKEGIIN